MNIEQKSEIFAFDIADALNEKSPISHASTNNTYGVATDTEYGHAKASNTTPKKLGTATVGTETGSFARGDHVHPTTTATSNVLGMVKLSNSTTSNSDADDGFAATPNAVKAAMDKANNAISELSVSGTTITYTRGNGDTGTINTQNTAATSSTLGLVKVGSNITNNSGTISLTKDNVTTALGYTPPTTDTKYTLPNATSSVLGGVKIGSNISVSSGVISLTKDNVTSALGYTPPTTDTKYTLPNATSSVLGGVKVGSNITNSSGTISLTKDNVTSALGYTPPTQDTVYTLPTATDLVLGGVKTGSNITNNNGTISLTKDNITNALGYIPETQGVLSNVILYKPGSVDFGNNYQISYTLPNYGTWIVIVSSGGGYIGGTSIDQYNKSEKIILTKTNDNGADGGTDYYPSLLAIRIA